MSNQNQQSGFLTFLTGLFKLIIAILFGLLIGGALYIVGSYVYQQAIVPSQNNAVALQTIQDISSEQWQQLKEKNSQLEERINTLEISQTDQTNQIDELQTALTQNQTNLETLLEDQDDLQEQVTDIEETLSQISKDQKTLKEDQKTLEQQLVETDQNEDQADALKPIQIELKLLKVMQQLNRSRLLLYQNNYGLAAEELALANQALEEMKTLTNEEQLDSVLLWQARLELIDSHLPEQPDLADEDLEILWQLMTEGFPQETPVEDTSVEEGQSLQEETAQGTATPTPTSTP